MGDKALYNSTIVKKNYSEYGKDVSFKQRGVFPLE